MDDSLYWIPDRGKPVANFLLALTKKWPIANHKNHYLILHKDGLELGLWLPNELKKFIIDDWDIINPEKIISEIEKIISESDQYLF